VSLILYKYEGIYTVSSWYVIITLLLTVATVIYSCWLCIF